MRRKTGLTVEKDSKGKPKRIIIDVDKFHEYELIEDLLDRVAAIFRKEEESLPAEDVFKEIEKRHRIKTA